MKEHVRYANLMKKIVTWIQIVSAAVLFINWGIVGLKLLDGNYDIAADVWIEAAFLIVCFLCVMYKVFTDRCPHCGKVRRTKGIYCSYCGQKIEQGEVK